jgi:hypothetical protein
VLGLIVLAAAGGGCSLLPFRAEPAPTAPAPAVADSTAAAENPVELGETTGPAPAQPPASGEATSPGTDTAGPGADGASPSPAPAPAPDPAAGDQVTVQISDTERAELEARARESLRAAGRVIRTIDRNALNAARMEKLTTAESLVDAAKAAFADDVRAAAALAHKASVLLAELTAK